MASKSPSGLEEAYNSSIAAQEKHLTIARGLIASGLRLLNSGDLDVDALTKAATTIERGTRMETKANDQILKLTRMKPRKR